MKAEKDWEAVDLGRFQRGSRAMGIFELADLFGVTTEALRKYEAKGLLQPYRDENGYRKYSSWDLTKIIRLRQLRQEGFSLENIAEELSQSEPRHQFRQLEEMRQTLEREIDHQKRLMTWLGTRQEELCHFQSLGKTCTVEELPREYCCVYMVGDTLAAKEGAEWDRLKEWIQALPFARVYHVANAGMPVGEALSCLSLREEELERYGFEHLVPDFILPKRVCAVCTLTAEASSVHDTSAQAVFQAHRRAEELELPLSGQYAIQMVWYTQQGSVFRSYNKAMFPIKK